MISETLLSTDMYCVGKECTRIVNIDTMSTDSIKKCQPVCQQGWWSSLRWLPSLRSFLSFIFRILLYIWCTLKWAACYSLFIISSRCGDSMFSRMFCICGLLLWHFRLLLLWLVSTIVVPLAIRGSAVKTFVIVPITSIAWKHQMKSTTIIWLQGSFKWCIKKYAYFCKFPCPNIAFRKALLYTHFLGSFTNLFAIPSRWRAIMVGISAQWDSQYYCRYLAIACVLDSVTNPQCVI